jgi:hypothetical protein
MHLLENALSRELDRGDDFHYARKRIIQIISFKMHRVIVNTLVTIYNHVWNLSYDGFYLLFFGVLVAYLYLSYYYEYDIKKNM